MTTATTKGIAVNVGDFFYASWGYDQTNVDFYKVVGFTPSGKSVRVQKWSSAIVASEHAYDASVIPGDSPATVNVFTSDYRYTGERRDVGVETKLLQYSGTKPYLAWASYANLYLYDGTPKYQTPAGYGH